MESRKVVLMNLFTEQQRRCRQSRLAGEGRRGWDKWRDEHGSIYTAMCKTAGQWGLCDSGVSTRGSVTAQRDGGFEREGARVFRWLTHADGRQRPTQCCEAIFLQSKINKFAVGEEY